MPKTKKTDKIPAKIKNYLEKAGIDHKILEHKKVYSAIDTAKTLKKNFNEVAKSLLVKADKDYYLVLLPADNNVDLEKIKKTLSKEKGKEIKTIKIPGEKMMEKALKVKAGALSGFGNAHKIQVVADKKLEKARKAIFSSGSLNHSVEMAVGDFVKLENAILGAFGSKKKIKVEKKPAPKKKTTTSKKKPAKKASPKTKSKK